MTNEKIFYDILQSKFTEREIPFEEGDWKSMKSMIDKSRTSKKRNMWIVGSLGLLLCAGGAFALYQGNNNSAKLNIVSINRPVNPSIASIPNTNNQTVNPTTTDKALATANNVAASPANTVTHNSSNTQNSQTISRNQPLTNGNNKVMASVNTPIYNNKNVKWVNHAPKSARKTLAIGNTNSSNESKQNIASQDNDPAVVSVSKEVAANSGIPASVVSTPALNSTTTAKATTVIAKTTVHKTDSVATVDAAAQRFSKEPRIFLGKADMFSVEAGTEFSGGWMLGSIVQAQGFNPIIGIGYTHYVGGTWFLKTGIQFSTLGNMSTLTYNYQHSVLNEIYDSVITTKRLYFLRIPLQAEYFIGRKSSIGFGGSVWFLLGNSGYATTYHELDNNPPPVDVVQYSQNAPLSGYAKVNASVHALYRYAFSRKFSMYGIIYMELTSMKENSFFGDDIIQRTHGFQITGAYTF